MISFPKRQYVRSKAMMEAYRKIPCQHCGADDGTVCGAHANWSQLGKGGHIKADDNRAASLCFECHMALDQGRLTTKEQRQQAWWSAHVATVWWPDTCGHKACRCQTSSPTHSTLTFFHHRVNKTVDISLPCDKIHTPTGAHHD